MSDLLASIQMLEMQIAEVRRRAAAGELTEAQKIEIARVANALALAGNGLPRPMPKACLRHDAHGLASLPNTAQLPIPHRPIT